MSDEHDDAAMSMALRSLRPEVDMVASRALFERERQRPRRSSNRVLLAAAAAVLVVGGVVGLWALAARDEPAAPVSTVETIADTTAAPATTTPATPTTSPDVPVSAPAASAGLVTLEVAEYWELTDAPRSVLYRAEIGNGPTELGLEDCTDCDPLMPWAPVVMPDGRVIIADNYNSRWVVVDDTTTVTPFDYAYPIAAPIVDADGRIYALIPQPNSANPTAAIADIYVFGADDLTTPIATYPAGPAMPWSTLGFAPDGLTVNGHVVEGTEQAVNADAQPEVQWNTPGVGASSIDVTWQGRTARWEFPVGWTIGGLGPAAQFADGSVLVYARDEASPSVGYWVRLTLGPVDAAVTAVPAAGGGLDDSATVSAQSVVTLERSESGTFEVVRYDLPTPNAATGTLPLPPGAPPGVVTAAFRDIDGNRCIEVRRSLSTSGVCFDDAVDDLLYGTAPVDDAGAVYVFGVVELAEATQVVAILPSGEEVDIPIVSIPGWPERAYVAVFDEPPTQLQARDSTGQVIASATN